MAQRIEQQALASYIASAFQRGVAALAERLGTPVEPTVSLWGQAAPDAWSQQLTGSHLLLSGSLRGGVEGPVVFALRSGDAARLAACAAGEALAPGAGDTKTVLSEAETAAVAFVLARVGAEASASSVGSAAAQVRWPSEAAELTLAMADLAEGPGPLLDALAAAPSIVGLRTRLPEPVGVEVTLLMPADLADALSRLAGGDAAAGARTTAIGQRELARLFPVAVAVRVELGRRKVRLREIADLVPGRVLSLDKPCGERLDLLAGSTLVAHGEAVVVAERLAFRVGELARGDSAASRRRKGAP